MGGGSEHFCDRVTSQLITSGPSRITRGSEEADDSHLAQRTVSGTLDRDAFDIHDLVAAATWPERMERSAPLAGLR